MSNLLKASSWTWDIALIPGRFLSFNLSGPDRVNYTYKIVHQQLASWMKYERYFCLGIRAPQLLCASAGPKVPHPITDFRFYIRKSNQPSNRTSIQARAHCRAIVGQQSSHFKTSIPSPDLFARSEDEPHHSWIATRNSRLQINLKKNMY